jgi:hypothetical protein
MVLQNLGLMVSFSCAGKKGKLATPDLTQRWGRMIGVLDLHMVITSLGVNSNVSEENVGTITKT